MTKSNPLLKGLMIAFSILILGISFIAWFSKTPDVSTRATSNAAISNRAAGDTSVETLKTLTAELANVQDQNQQLITQNKALKTEDSITLAQFKEKLMNNVQQALSQAEVNNQSAQTKIDNALNSIHAKLIPAETEKYPIDTPKHSQQHYTWVTDMGSNPTNNSQLASPQLASTESNNAFSLLHSNPMQENHDLKKSPKPFIPFITIPQNATLTGAVAMQPLVGRVPIDGRVPDPYTFKVALGAKNLAASGIYIPPRVQGAVASGIATGDMLGECVRGTITSLTFVFQDGTISTVNAKDNGSLGTISTANGNPCIRGDFHTNAPIALGGTIAIAGAEGYANALSQSQFQNSVVNGSIISTLKSANTYALGQAGSSAAESAQRWWQQRVQNSFDFVYVPNVDPHTGQLLKLVLNISKQITIDYNPQGRKVYYGHSFQTYVTQQLD